MTKKEEIIEYVIGNEFITKPSLQQKFLRLLDEVIQEQCNIADVVGRSEQYCDCTHEPPIRRLEDNSEVCCECEKIIP
jgi:hypothetical protein